MKNKITLTGKQILELASFAALSTNSKNDEDVLEQLITIEDFPEKGVLDEDRNSLMEEGEFIVYLDEYPEEGCLILDKKDEA